MTRRGGKCSVSRIRPGDKTPFPCSITTTVCGSTDVPTERRAVAGLAPPTIDGTTGVPSGVRADLDATGRANRTWIVSRRDRTS